MLNTMTYVRKKGFFEKSFKSLSFIPLQYPRLSIIFSIILASSALNYLTFDNNYPLILGDSIGYIGRAYTRTINHHWALFYSVFIRVTSLNYSLFITVLTQNALVAMTLYLVVIQLFPISLYRTYFILITLILVTISSLPHISNLLMSDIFSSLGLLSLAALVFLRPRVWSKAYFIVLLSISFISHNSHAPIFIAFSILILSAKLILARHSNKFAHESIVSQILQLFLVFLLSSFLLKPLTNSLFHNTSASHPDTKKEVVSDSKYHFIWRKISRTEQYQDFLAKYCPEKNYYYLCDSDRMEVLKQDGLTNDMHGNNTKFLEEVEDAGRMVLFDPYFFWNTYKPQIKNIGTILNNHRIRNPFQNKRIRPIIIKNLPEDEKYLVNSKSYNNKLYSREELAALEKRNRRAILTSLAILSFGGILLLMIEYSPILLGFIYSMPLAHLINASFMAFFANPNARYCSRTSWLLVFSALLVLLVLFEKRQSIQSLLWSK